MCVFVCLFMWFAYSSMSHYFQLGTVCVHLVTLAKSTVTFLSPPFCDRDNKAGAFQVDMGILYQITLVGRLPGGTVTHPSFLPSLSPALGVQGFSQPLLAPYPSSVTNVSSNKFLACFILSWYLLLGRPQLTHILVVVVPVLPTVYEQIETLQSHAVTEETAPFLSSLQFS